MNNIKVIPIISYIDIEKNKSLIYKENKNKSGIYRLNNLITGSSYIGSSVDIAHRLGNHFSINFLKRETRRNNSRISNSLLKYGHNKFSLDIIEYCESTLLFNREQYYIDTLQCDYNILKIAGSRKGYKHTVETLLKFKNRKLSAEALINLKKAKKGIAPNYPLRLKNLILALGYVTIVTNKKDNTTKVYESMRALARDIGINRTTIRNYVNTNKWLKDTYLISTKKID